METMYLCIVVFLLCLAVFDLFVGVSNDAVNFLQSAVGARVASLRTLLVIASVAVVVGAVLSSGMMDIARHGIMMPARFTFAEVMTIFLAVMVTDVIVLDVFNTLGMPTSTTVSLVFELLGGTAMLAVIKVAADPALAYGSLLNSDKALQVIIAIFVSVAISFVVGMVVMWLSRVIFTFRYRHHGGVLVAVFGGLSFTVLAYFIFIKGLGGSSYVPADVKTYIGTHTNLLLLVTAACAIVFMEVLRLLRVDVFKLVVLIGTFGLAMSFAGNDLVNFIGVPLAGLSSYQDFVTSGSTDPNSFMMTSLMSSAKTPPLFLLVAGCIMIVAMATSKKAQNVIKTSVDLARQGEGEEMFGSSGAARAIVRWCQSAAERLSGVLPKRLSQWLDSRFNTAEAEPADPRAAFDAVRAAVNLVVASALITFGTNHKLPLSTTYVTFMVAMGTSLADRAWARESAVFRVTGVMNVIGGWFITAGVAFATCALVALVMWYGGLAAQVGFMALVVFLLWRSNRRYKEKKARQAQDDSMFRLMMRTRDPQLVWDMLCKHVTTTQSFVSRYAQQMYGRILDAFEAQNARELGRCYKSLRREEDFLKKYRRQEMLVLRRVPQDIALERNTWFHLGADADRQFVYSLRRMLEPVREHVDNNFNPLPEEYAVQLKSLRQRLDSLMRQSRDMIDTRRYDGYDDLMAEADGLRRETSMLRKQLIDRLQQSADQSLFQVSLVYLNILQETQEFLSVMRHQLRADKKFIAG